MKVNKNKLGLVIGSFVGFTHLIWAIFVATGLAQFLIDFIVRLHFIDLKHKIAPFDFTTAVLFVVIGAIIGYIAGLIFGIIWNAIYASNSSSQV